MLTALRGNTQKRLVPSVFDGSPTKDTSHDLGIYEGRVTAQQVSSLAEFAAVLAGIKPNQALTLGTTGSAKTLRVTTAAKREEMVGNPASVVARTLDFFSWPGDGYFYILLDHDPEPGKPDITADQLWERFTQVMPEFQGAGRVVTVSSSSAIFDKATGKCLTPASGHHTFAAVKGDVKRFKEILKARCWLAGEGFYKLGAQNKVTGTPSALERFLVDMAVFSPERIIYEAGADIDPSAPFEQRRPAPQVFDGAHQDLDSIPDLTPEELARAEAIRKKAHDAITLDRVKSVSAHIKKENPALSSGEVEREAKRRTNSCDRGELAADHILYLADGGTLRAGDIGPQHNRVTLRDPQEPDYRGGATTAIIYCDKPGKWLIHSQAHGGANYRPAAPSKGEAKAKADSFKAAARAAVQARSAAILEQRLTTPDHISAGKYLDVPPLPEGFGGYALDAPLGGGKTTAIGGLARGNHESGGFTAQMGPRNSMGKQTAQKQGIPHIHDFGPDPTNQRALGAMARDAGSLVFHTNSLSRAVEHFPDHPLHTIIDEPMATLSESFHGGTLGRRFSEINELLFSTLRRSETVTLSESGLDKSTINLIERITGKPLYKVRHHGTVNPFQVDLISSSNAWHNALYTTLVHPIHGNVGTRVWVNCTSKNEAHEIAEFAEQNGIDYMLVTGDTNEAGNFDGLFQTPDPFLEARKPQLLITTQTCQTGLSVEGDHFDVVFGYGPSFAPDMLYQMLGRYRRPVPRVVWVPPFIKPEWDEKPQANHARAEIDKEVSQWCGIGFDINHRDPDQELIDQYLAEQGEIAWALKVDPRQGLKHLLEQGGHSMVTKAVELSKDEAEQTRQTRQDCREALAQRRSAFHAELEIDPDFHGREWVTDARNRETTYRERAILFKLSCLERFPGIDWESAPVWYEGFFKPKEHEDGEIISGPLAPGAALWAECEHVAHFAEHDWNEVEIAMLERLRCARLLPTHSKKLSLLAPLRPYCEQLLNQGQVRPGDVAVRGLSRAARAIAPQLERYFRITCDDTQSDIAIACKVLRKFGLFPRRDKKETRRGGGNDARQWNYTLDIPDLWRSLASARAFALETLNSNGSKGGDRIVNPPFYNSVPSSPPDMPPDTWAELLGMVATAKREGAAALEALKATIIAAFSSQTWETLGGEA